MIEQVNEFIGTIKQWLHEHSKANSIYFIREHRKRF